MVCVYFTLKFLHNAWCHVQENRHFYGHRLENIILLLLSVAYAVRHVTLCGISLAVAHLKIAVAVFRRPLEALPFFPLL
jgi:hypothetical protein